MAFTGHRLLVLYFLLCVLRVCLSTVSTTSQQRQTATSQTTRTSTPEIPEELEGYVPTVPSPENVNCYIEVPTLQTVGGRCVRFGRSRMWSCQSGIHIQMSNDCERVSRRNEQNLTRRRTRGHRINGITTVVN